MHSSSLQNEEGSKQLEDYCQGKYFKKSSWLSYLMNN